MAFTPKQRSFVDALAQPSATGTRRTAQRNELGALRAQRQARPRLPPRDRSTFASSISDTELQRLHDEVDRGSTKLLHVRLGKGVGDFEDLIDAARDLTKVVGADGEAAACQAMLNVVRQYCTDKRREAYQAEKDKGAKGDQKTIRKFEAALKMGLEARRLQQDRIDDSFLSTNTGDPTPREGAHEVRARQMAQAFGAQRAPSGTSVVHLIKNADDKVAYAFKSVAGEPESVGMAKGGGAVREAMASAMCRTIKSMTGLDFGFPEVAICQYSGETGAMIEGMDGVSYDPNWLAGKVRAELGDMNTPRKSDYPSDEAYEQAKRNKREWDHKREALLAHYAPESERRKAQASKIAQKLPAKELQKVLMSNYAMAQFDIKWDNLMMKEEGNTATARPFDGGAGFLADETLEDAPWLLDDGPDAAGNILLKDPIKNSEYLPSALQPVDADLRKQFLGIDLAALKKTLDDERERLARVHGLDATLLPDKAMQRSYKSIQIVQEVLSDPDVRTTADFVAAYCKRMTELRDPG